MQGYGITIGCVVSGYHSCPICGEHLKGRYSKALKKCIFTNHRCFLNSNHPFNNESKILGYEQETAPILEQLFGQEWLESCQINTKVKKRVSIFFQLPYWKDLLIRNLVDGMHIEKNVCSNIMKLLLGLNDTKSVREDLENLKIREDSWLTNIEPAPTKNDHTHMKAFQQNAPWVLDENEKKIFINRVTSLRFPSLLASNPRAYFGGKNGDELQHLKSHDFHVLMQHIIPVALRGLLQLGPRRAIYHLCHIFQHVNSPILDPLEFPMILEDAVETLCLLNKELPPTSFTISFHLVLHLIPEMTVCGVIHSRWMYLVERYFKTLKSFVKNMAKPEGSIGESYWLTKNISFFFEYVSYGNFAQYRKKLGGPLQNNAKNDVIFQKRGKKEITLSNEVRRHIDQYLISNIEVLAPWHL